MKEVLRYGFLALAGWLVYRQFFAGGDRGEPGAEPSEGATASSPVPSSTLVLMTTAASKYGFKPTQTAHEWNWLYSQEDVRGTAAPDPGPAFPDVDTFTHRLTLQEWYDAMRGQGISGLWAKPQGWEA